MFRQFAPFLPLVLAAVLVACRNNGNEGQSRTDTAGPSASPQGATPRGAAARRPDTQATSFTGTLRGGVMAIGGESTGWRLEGDGQTGAIELDVAKIRDRAIALDGRRVTITGRMTTHSGPERGDRPVLVAETIAEAKQDAPGAR